jgi:hypothetical protein
MRLLLTWTLFLFSLGAVAADDWSQQFGKYGCGRFGEGDAYQDGIKQCSTQAAKYQAKCQQDGGQFRWQYRKGFCTPEDPNSLFCRTECLVVADVFCRTPLFTPTFDITELAGNGNGTAEPGEKLSVKVSLTNLKKSLLRAITGEISVPSPLITVPAKFLAWDDVGVGQTLVSTSAAEVHIAKEVPCGTQSELKLSLKTDGGSQEVTYPFRVGKFSGVPLTAAAQDLTTAIGGTGAAIALPIALPAASTAVGTRKIQFGFKLALKGTRHVRVTLTAPDNSLVGVLYNGNATGSVTYDQDLTSFFGKAKSIGEWKLVASVSGQPQDGTLTQYQLMVLPESYTCQ